MGFSYDGNFHVDNNGYVLVYTDGCCYFNGQPNARGGFGVYFGPGHPDNISAPLWGETQTNNRAEILAVYFALKTIYKAGYRRAEVRTDSHYLIDCITTFMPKWKENGWITSQGHEAKSRRELELLDFYDQMMDDVCYTHVPRASDSWNDEADSLAKNGANQHDSDDGEDDDGSDYNSSSDEDGYYYNQYN